jgi:hypothetical protein
MPGTPEERFDNVGCGLFGATVAFVIGCNLYFGPRIPHPA